MRQGRVAIPTAARVRAVLGIDPEPVMLARATAKAARSRRTHVSWMLGSDADLAALGAPLDGRSITALVMGNAIHLMDHEGLFSTACSLIRPGGGIALLANSNPIWRQDSACSRAVCAALEEWFDTKLTSMCGTDHASAECTPPHSEPRDTAT